MRQCLLLLVIACTPSVPSSTSPSPTIGASPAPPSLSKVIPTVLARFHDNFRGTSLAIDATHAYFTDRYEGRVWRVAKTGEAPEVLAKGLGAPSSCLVEGNELWVSAGSVIAIPLAGGPPRAVANAAGTLVRGPDAVYVANPVRGLARIARSGATTVVTSRPITAVAGGAAVVYTTERDYEVARTDTLWRLTSAGPIELAALPSTAHAIATSDSTIYVEVSMTDGDAIFTMPLSGGELTPFVDHQNVGGELVVDDQYLWWTSGPEVVRASLGSRVVERYAWDSGPHGRRRAIAGHSLVSDGDAVYWISETQPGFSYPASQVLRAAKRDTADKHRVPRSDGASGRSGRSGRSRPGKVYARSSPVKASPVPATFTAWQCSPAGFDPVHDRPVLTCPPGDPTR